MRTNTALWRQNPIGPIDWEMVKREDSGREYEESKAEI